MNISNKILKTAQKDSELRNLFVDLGIYTKKEYNAMMKQSLKDNIKSQNSLKKGKTKNKTQLTMSLWVDSKGNIAGRNVKFKQDKETVSFGYKTTKKNFTKAFEIWTKSNGKDTLRGTGKITTKLTGAAGNLKLTLSDSDSKSKEVIKATFNNLKLTKSDNGSFINGAFEITSNSSKDMIIKAKLTGEDSKQDFVCDVIENGTTLVSISSTAKIVPYQDFTLPTSSDKIYDMSTQLEEYLTNSDMVGFLEGIKEKSDVNTIDAFIDNLLLSYEINN